MLDSSLVHAVRDAAEGGGVVVIRSPHNPPPLQASRDYCERLTRERARNFYYGLKLLPPEKRGAMFALYAWMRLVDDIADEEDGRPLDAKLQALEAFAAETRAVIASGAQAGSDHVIWPAFADMATRCRVPQLVFEQVIEGQRQDLQPIRFDTFEQLDQYCYRVAGVVGLASIHIWGFEGGAATEQLAVQRGAAFQLTNILRDLREDLARGRIYLPQCEIQDVFPLAIGSAKHNPAFIAMMNFQISRAQRYYEMSAPLEGRISPDSRPTLVAMTEIYHGLLDKIRKRPWRVLSGRVSLSAWTKLRIAWRAMRAGRGL